MIIYNEDKSKIVAISNPINFSVKLKKKQIDRNIKYSVRINGVTIYKQVVLAHSDESRTIENTCRSLIGRLVYLYTQPSSGENLEVYIDADGTIREERII